MTPKEFADRMNRLTPEEISQAMENISTDALEWAGKFEGAARDRRLLQELFCSRHLGDGFRAVVSGILYSLDNRNGEPLTEIQITEIRAALVAVLVHPGIDFDAACGLLDKLEDAGLVVDPAFMEVLVEVLSND